MSMLQKSLRPFDPPFGCAATEVLASESTLARADFGSAVSFIEKSLIGRDETDIIDDEAIAMIEKRYDLREGHGAVAAGCARCMLKNSGCIPREDV
jgi:hypothetical protein